jgi:hypothetical protein
MKKTLQDQYLLIKEGKGHKGVFLADAKRQFPNIVRNAATFEEASSCLKTKNIISENVIGLNAINSIFEPKKKESYELAFENFLAEAKKKKEEDEKAELKATSKQVEKDLEHNFDYKDDKNPDNLIFDQIMTGYYTEMKDPKNVDKTMQELKDMVFKNLQKDPIFYTKEGQFGVKGLGYSVDHPGLGEPKEPKGKYKASGYGDLNEGMDNMDPLEREARIALSRIGYSYSVLSTNTRQNLIDTLKKESKNRSGDKEFDNLVYRLESTENKSLEESKLRKVIREMIDAELEEAGRGFATMGTINIGSDKQGKIFIPKYYILPPIARRKLNLLNVGENAPAYDESIRIPHIKVLPDNTILFSTYLVSALENPSDIKNPLNNILNNINSFHWDQFKTYVKKFISSSTVKYPIFGREAIYNVIGFPNDFNVEKLKDWLNEELPKQYAKLEKAESGEKGRGRPVNIESLKKFIINLENLNQDPEGGMIVVLPMSYTEETTDSRFNKSSDIESLRESVEKELAAINKEAEHEIIASKLEKVQALIDKKQTQISRLDEDEDLKDLTDAKKVKEISKDIKSLEKAKAKLEKMMHKGKAKSPRKEVIDEDDVIDEVELNSEFDI